MKYFPLLTFVYVGLAFVSAFVQKNPRLAEIWASVEWDQAANKWLRDTLNICKKLRPRANWGYYHFPDCFQYKSK